MREQKMIAYYDYFEWVEYIHLCEKLGWQELMPENFIVSYNYAREAAELTPKIYEPSWYTTMTPPYFRIGNMLEFAGVFPCDEEGNPFMQWIGLKIENGYKIKECTCKKEKYGRLRIEVNPDTVIHCMKVEEDGERVWERVYTGPLKLDFNYSVLKDKRLALGYTQKEVAAAAGVDLSTYRKWEHGQAQPEGHYLLRLMNWLDIRNIQDVIKYDIRE